MPRRLVTKEQRQPGPQAETPGGDVVGVPFSLMEKGPDSLKFYF